ncbi:unannotated protein [freshwater metagenome]|uniref:Unannotated protein n=1 Tax=freshwater metagenome TaxID=449393 RepID=A0A6J7KP67_9ZZZZ
MTRDDLHRLEKYADRLRLGYPNIEMVFISGGEFEIPEKTINQEIRLLRWSEVHRRTAGYYEHYRAVLTGDVADPSFGRKEEELRINAQVLAEGSYRQKGADKPPIGPQDTGYPLPLPPAALPPAPDGAAPA